jgi:hypothetical protein
MRPSVIALAVGCLVWVGARPAGADPVPAPRPATDPPSTRPANERASPPAGSEAKPTARAAPRLPASGVPLLLPGLPPAPAGAADRPIDLFPDELFGGRGTFRPFAFGDKEHKAGASLGDDGDWRVQAAQIGVMAGAFAALVGLCSGGRCMLPEQATSWLPDFLEADQPAMPPLRREPALRQAR